MGLVWKYEVSRLYLSISETEVEITAEITVLTLKLM